MQGILNDNHGGPCNPAGIRIVDALADVQESLGRIAASGKSGPAFSLLGRPRHQHPGIFCDQKLTRFATTTAPVSQLASQERHKIMKKSGPKKGSSSYTGSRLDCLKPNNAGR